MPKRNTMSSGGYPTGRAPFSMDLSSQMDVIGQRLVQNRRDQIKEEKLQITESEDAVLNALDFKTLEGAGDKFAEEHAKRLDDLNLKWAKTLKDRGGILNTKDKLDLSKDKKDVEAKMQIGAAEIAQLQEIQKTLRTPGQKVFDTIPTSAGIIEYTKAGLVGTGKLLNYVKMYEEPFLGGWKNRMINLGDKRTQNRNTDFESDITGTDDQGNNKIAWSNKKSVDGFIEFAMQDKDFQDALQDNPEQAMKELSTVRATLLREINHETPKRATTGTGSPTYQDKKTAKSNQANAFNDWAERVYQDDKSSMQLLLHDKIESLDNYADRVVVTFTNGEEKSIYKKNKLDFKRELWDLAPKSMKEGLSNEGVSNFIKENYDLAEPVTEKLEYTDVSEGKVKFNDFSSVIDSYNNPDAETKSTGEDIAKAINELIPSAKAKFKKAIIGKNKIVFNSKEYDISTPDGKEQLKSDVLGEIDKEKNKKKEKPSNKVVVFTIEGEDGTFSIPENEVAEFLKENPTAKMVQ